MQIAFVLDIIIAFLLVLTITYAVRLNQRLSQLRSDKQELQELAKTFADATTKAEAGIKNLKSSSEELRIEVKKAKGMRDDLAALVERGMLMADRASASPSPVGPASAGRPVGPASSGRPLGNGPRPLHAQNEEDRLIEEASLAATPDQKRPSRGGALKSLASRRSASGGAASGGPDSGARAFGGAAPMQSQSGFRDDDLAPLSNEDGDVDFPYSANSTPQGPRPLDRPQPQLRPQSRPAAATSPAPASLGGGLGGMTSQDRLFDGSERKDGAPGSVGDTDAARELLKALSSVK